ncbi:1,5-anhydro-D-fructose reductase [Aquimixticola soesokkakensis]|uniref:1,5-anhydro-D-fructose reductase n=1 Tax=Aquimixticola soesokkakensis TaxID=1519096 RepID=A0A1Y5TI27_9RHOB|nr:Gfo/Idh/MocA family oxidoreductase [Aquimixticola soesokkakensis]SLN64161.1 1,5-anhydro-D-fructose reductase [Aquimixticola soesokkakensis]
MSHAVQTAVLVGCGAMSEGWLRAIQTLNATAPTVDVIGFVDLDETLARHRADTSGFPDAAAGADLGAMLAALEPDVVFDIVVPAARRSVVTTAFAAGCDVLSEKPLGNTLGEARDLAAARDRSARLHGVVQNRRHLTGIRRAKAFLDSGAIGTVAEVHCDFFIAPHFGGFREEMEHVLLHDMAIHTFDAARFVAGVEPARAVCLESNPAHSWYAHGASAAVLFACENGVTMSYRGSWCAEGLPTSWEASWRIVGSKGTLLWDGNDGFQAEVPQGRDGLLSTQTPLEVPQIAPLAHEGHAGVIADFLEARRTGRSPLTDARDNIRSLAMTFAAIDSAEQGRFIDISV